MAKTLTAIAVKNYRHGKERREISDGGCPGLFLVIQASGHKSWAMRFRRPSGKPAKLTLGPVDLSGSESATEPVIGQPLTLASARRLAAEVHHQRAKGSDVIADHDATKLRQKSEQVTRAASTFGAAAMDFVERHAKKKTRHWKETARLLGLMPTPEGKLEDIAKGLADRWGNKPVSSIDGHDIYALVDETRRLGVPGLGKRGEGPSEARARSMFATLSKMFSWLVQHRRVEKNPCAGVHRPDTPKSRDRVLTDAEVVKFWKATDAEQFGALLKLLLLTGSRLNEVAGMRRTELSDDDATWTIDGSRTKNKQVHVVPLPLMARELIPAGEGEFVFTTTGVSQVAIGSKVKGRLDEVMKIPPWRFHDLRRTAASGMAKLEIPPHVIEATLNHISGAKAGVAGTYNRWGYLPQKESALQRWASHIEGLVAGRKANVVPMRGSAR